MGLVTDKLYVGVTALVAVVWLVAAVKAAVRAAARVERRDWGELAALAAIVVAGLGVRLWVRVPTVLVEAYLGATHLQDAVEAAQFMGWGGGISFYPAAMAVTVAPVFWFLDPSIGVYQLVNVVLGSGTVFLVWAICKGLVPGQRGPALASALVMAFLPLHVKYSGMEVLVIGALFYSCAAVAGVLWYRRSHEVWGLVFGLAAAYLAAASRVEVVGVLGVVALAAVWPVRGVRPASWPVFLAGSAALALPLSVHLLRTVPMMISYGKGDLLGAVLTWCLPSIVFVVCMVLVHFLWPAGRAWVAGLGAASLFACALVGGLSQWGTEFLSLEAMPLAGVGQSVTFFLWDPALLNPKVTPLLVMALALAGLGAAGGTREGRGVLLAALWFIAAFVFSRLKATGGVAFVNMRGQVMTLAPIAILSGFGAAAGVGWARGSRAVAAVLAAAVVLTLPTHHAMLGFDRLLLGHEYAFLREALKQGPEVMQVLYPSGAFPVPPRTNPGGGQDMPEIRPWIGPMFGAAGLEAGRTVFTMEREYLTEEAVATGRVYYYEGADCYRNGATHGIIPACVDARQGLDLDLVATAAIPVGQESPEELASLYIAEEFVPLYLYKVVGVSPRKQEQQAR
jgi:hypothetical protein